MILNPKKILVLHNTQYSNSKDLADYYVAARGLNPAHVLGFDFGTADVIPLASAASFIANIVATVRDYIAANGIQGIALSIHLPKALRFATASPQYDGDSSLCRVLGSASYAVANPSSRVRSLWNVQQASELHAGHATINTARLTGTQLHWLDAPQGTHRTIPCGRLGYRASTIGADDLATAQRCIDDAVWFERFGSPNAMPMLFGLSNRGVTYMQHANVWQAYQVLASQVGRAHVYDGNYSGRTSATYAGSSPMNYYSNPVADINAQQFLAGTVQSKITLWGWLGTGAENIANAWAPAVQFERGAWMFESTSSGISQHALGMGACAAIVPVQEPYNYGLPVIGQLAEFLLQGYSLEEATLASTVAGIYANSTEVWGDPFYSPFLPSITADTAARWQAAALSQAAWTPAARPTTWSASA